MMKKMALGIITALWVAQTAQATEISIEGPLGPFRGTLIDKGVNAPAVIIIPGSGVIDRNGLPPNGIGLGMYQSLSEGLANAGISSLRYDKRGIFGSSTAVDGYEDLRIATYADDVLRWAQSLKKQLGTSCIWLIGHSEGGLVGSVAITRQPDLFCGMIFAAAPGRSIDLILHDQLMTRTKSKRVMRKLEKVVAKLRQGVTVPDSEIPIALRPMFSPVNQRYLMDWMTYQPANVISEFEGPVLIIQGTNDIQISPQDADHLAAEIKQAEITIFKGVNHVFQKTDLMFPPKDLGVAPEVIKRVSQFINAAH